MWGVILGVPALAYLAALIVPVARARGERRYLVPICIASLLIGAGLLIAGGFDDDWSGRVLLAVGIGAALGLAGFALRRRRPVAYILAPLLSGGLAAFGIVVLFLGAVFIGDFCVT